MLHTAATRGRSQMLHTAYLLHTVSMHLTPTPENPPTAFDSDL